eukprot:Gregarina_sp_Poly_1__7159@NODE_3926_length_820_cov_352_590969_g2524_i1_p1_GENE_NODE_3926_length_820_cov_352_590969_g2524_i1NODE_3926_length_820_cov_352_590969_g2524_i1_p1_ORF_typecomplete_len237_score10_24DUF1129/PF06570_11/2_9e02DUF1129/PF06570_11/0_032_NODE_3926_length_820_cov_352_590969_g2524_i110720
MDSQVPMGSASTVPLDSSTTKGLPLTASPKTTRTARLRRWGGRLFVNGCLLGVFYINCWIGVALLARLFFPPHSYLYSEWQSTDPSNAGKVASACEASYETRKFMVEKLCVAWISMSAVQGSGILSALKIVQQGQTCFASFCAVATAMSTLAMMGCQIYLVRQWLASSCEFTPINSLEAKINRGFLITQILTVIVAWYIFTVWCKPFSPVWQKLNRNKRMSGRWSCKSDGGSTTAQ